MCTMNKLTEKVHTLRQLESEVVAMNSRIEALKNEIKEELNRRGVSELVGDDWKVTWNSYSSSRFDQSAFRKAHPDLYESFKVISESKRFTVK